jgi:hypothetical protein
MRLSKDWNDFDNKFNQLYGQQMLDFPEENEEEMLSDFNQNLKKGLGWNPKENN